MPSCNVRTNWVAYQKHKYSGPRKNLRRVRAALKRWTGQSSRLAVWRGQEKRPKSVAGQDLIEKPGECESYSLTEGSERPLDGLGVPPFTPQPTPTEKTETATHETQDEDSQTGDEEMQPQQVEIKQEFEEENLIILYQEIGPERIGTTPAQATDEYPISIHRIQPSTSTAASDVDPLVKTEILEEPEIRDSDSDIESAFDTPKEAELRRIIKKKDKEIERLQELVKKLTQRR